MTRTLYSSKYSSRYQVPRLRWATEQLPRRFRPNAERVSDDATLSHNNVQQSNSPTWRDNLPLPICCSGWELSAQEQWSKTIRPNVRLYFQYRRPNNRHSIHK